MDFQKHNELVAARTQNQEAINELRQQPQVSPTEIQALFNKERELSRLIQQEIDNYWAENDD